MDYRRIRNGHQVHGGRASTLPANSNRVLRPVPGHPLRPTGVPRSVKRSVARAVGQGVRSGRLPISPRAIASQLAQELAELALNSVVRAQNPVNNNSGLWYGRMSGGDPGPVPGEYFFNDGRLSYLSWTSGGFASNWKLLSRELIRVGPAKYIRTHKVSPGTGDLPVVTPATEEVVVPLPDDLFSDDPASQPMRDYSRTLRIRHRPFQVDLPIYPYPAIWPRLHRWLRTGPPGDRYREAKGRGARNALAAAWVLTEVLDWTSGLMDIYDRYYRDDGRFSADEMPDILLDLLSLAVEELVIDPIIAPLLSGTYVDYRGIRRSIPASLGTHDYTGGGFEGA